MKKALLSGLAAGIVLGTTLSAAAAESAPKAINIGYQKANIFALLKYRGTLDEQFKKQGIAVRWVEFPAGPQMLEGLNVGSIDLTATGEYRHIISITDLLSFYSCLKPY